MKHLKKFNENKFSIDKLKKEIEDLNYILDDENVKFRIYVNSGMGYGNHINIHFDFPINGDRIVNNLRAGRDTNYNEHYDMMKKLLSEDFFIEYLNRVDDIAKKYDYDIFILKNHFTIFVASPHYIKWKSNIKYNIKDKILNQ